MAEHWSEFFTLSQPRTRERDRIVLASTTDSQDALDEAARRRRHEAATDPEVVYTEVMPATPNVDGGVEHGALLVKSNIPEHDEEEPCALEKMTLEERMRSVRNYGAQADAARIHYGDEWAEALDAEVPIPVGVVVRRLVIFGMSLSSMSRLTLVSGTIR